MNTYLVMQKLEGEAVPQLVSVASTRKKAMARAKRDMRHKANSRVVVVRKERVVAAAAGRGYRGRNVHVSTQVVREYGPEYLERRWAEYLASLKRIAKRAVRV